MEYAILESGGKQYRVSPGTLIDLERLEGAAGESVTLKPVLAVRKETAFQIGTPEVAGASVTAEIVAQRRGPKVVSFKFKRRKGYHRKVGHRQELTRVKVVEIRTG